MWTNLQRKFLIENFIFCAVKSDIFFPGASLGSCQTSLIESFVKKVNRLKVLTIFNQILKGETI